MFVEETRRSYPFKMQGIYSDNGSEYKGSPGHPVRDLCRRYKMSQSFTKVKHPWTNGKTERVIKTLMAEWCTKSSGFISRDHRRRALYAYVTWYNQSRIHQSLGCTPLERLESYLQKCQQRLINVQVVWRCTSQTIPQTRSNWSTIKSL
ncbi:MAG: transposase [Parcubacteria group bacterium]|nr:transposase [Parcubacteria group bacterium]